MRRRTDEEVSWEVVKSPGGENVGFGNKSGKEQVQMGHYKGIIKKIGDWLRYQRRGRWGLWGFSSA